jgi:hypothetical protein
MDTLSGAAKTEFDAFAAAYAHTADAWYGFIWYSVKITRIELGRRVQMGFRTQAFPSGDRIRAEGDAAFGPRWKGRQVTLRDIALTRGFQRKGFFAALVEHLLVTVGAVQLEAVQPDWLKARLAASPRWVCQTAPEYADYNPCYVRFERGDGDFALF